MWLSANHDGLPPPHPPPRENAGLGETTNSWGVAGGGGAEGADKGAKDTRLTSRSLEEHTVD